jgi:hypothetical protein
MVTTLPLAVRIMIGATPARQRQKPARGVGEAEGELHRTREEELWLPLALRDVLGTSVRIAIDDKLLHAATVREARQRVSVQHFHEALRVSQASNLNPNVTLVSINCLSDPFDREFAEKSFDQLLYFGLVPGGHAIPLPAFDVSNTIKSRLIIMQLRQN